VQLTIAETKLRPKAKSEYIPALVPSGRSASMTLRVHLIGCRVRVRTQTCVFHRGFKASARPTGAEFKHVDSWELKKQVSVASHCAILRVCTLPSDMWLRMAQTQIPSPGRSASVTLSNRRGGRHSPISERRKGRYDRQRLVNATIGGPRQPASSRRLGIRAAQSRPEPLPG